MKYICMILACFALNVFFHHSMGVQSENSDLENIVQNMLILNSYHAGMDSITFTPNQFEHLDSNITTTTVNNYTVLFNNLTISEMLRNYAYYTTSVQIASGNITFVVSLPCDFKIDADVKVQSPYVSEQITHNDSISLQFKNIVFSKPLTIASNGSLLENEEAPKITINNTKICTELDSHSKFGKVIYEATENLIDIIKKKMETIWLKQFERQLNKTRNYFPLYESEFPNELDPQQNRNTSDVFNITGEMESLKKAGITTKSITIDGLSNFAELKMIVKKDANRASNENWSYHCAKTESRIETNELRGQLTWSYNYKSSTSNLITFHIKGFVMKVIDGSSTYVHLDEIEIDPANSYGSCNMELLQNVFADQLAPYIVTSINNRFYRTYRNKKTY